VLHQVQLLVLLSLLLLAAYVNPIGAFILGLIAGVASSCAVSRKYKFGYDDSLDVVGVHGC
jgi:ammonia channel protein AmtB